ncbi:MAG: hypothetical protein IJY38_03290 [Clostridia bacterium]|nr:hypothetical protein [Clostridia bacterium]
MNKEKTIQNCKNKIVMLKRKLSQSDYMAIKFAEGVLSEEEYADTKVLRNQCRLEINTLEEKIQALKEIEQ